jgi:hypothetical protein
MLIRSPATLPRVQPVTSRPPATGTGPAPMRTPVLAGTRAPRQLSLALERR